MPELTTKEFVETWPTYFHFTEWIAPYNQFMYINHGLLSGKCYVDALGDWYRFGMYAPAIITGDERRMNLADEQMHNLQTAKQALATANMRQMVADSFGTGRVFIPVANENWQDLVDDETVQEQGKEVAEKDAREYAASNKVSNDKWRGLGAVEEEGYLKIGCSRVIPYEPNKE